MDTRLPHPVLAAVIADAVQPPVLVPAIPKRSLKRLFDAVESIVYFGLLGFGVGFPFVATIYALIAY